MFLSFLSPTVPNYQYNQSNKQNNNKQQNKNKGTKKDNWGQTGDKRGQERQGTSFFVGAYCPFLPNFCEFQYIGAVVWP